MPSEIQLSLELNQFFKSIYRHRHLKLPLTKKDDLVTDFIARCDVYNSHLRDYATQEKDQLAELIPEILEVSIEVQYCIALTMTSFLSGNIKLAYDTFDKTFSNRNIYKHLRRISIPLSDLCNEKKPLFRVRKSEKPLDKRKDLFHIPFSMRHLVGAQRYSVAGLPCLYLGTSIYIYWQEMGKPDLGKLFISSFKSKDSKSQVLNLAAEFLYHRMRSSPYSEDISFKNNSLKISYLILWPLIAACNYKKSDENSNFIQEYIIPNLLMQWISTKDRIPISGIAYRSTKFSKSTQSPQAVNIVLPPKVDYAQTIKYDFCPTLCSIFDITPPVSWQILKTLNYSVGGEMTSEQLKAIDVLKKKEVMRIRNFDEDLVSLYPLTDFYKLEIFIHRYMNYAELPPGKDGDKMAAELSNKLKRIDDMSNQLPD
ncbi:hypothetical protein ACHOYD_17640 [Enterobacter hormaechei]|uniref:hypothetical protein n=1 Tax=Enterobacter cloacae complex TaxID=354276 RepID=UPI0022EC3E25|nr:hypothetical protein [Enterobacter hormaechei]WBT22696.1 hypothetical protein PF325_18485 [Enterobacter hormaechei]